MLSDIYYTSEIFSMKLSCRFPELLLVVVDFGAPFNKFMTIKVQSSTAFLVLFSVFMHLI